MATSTVLEIIMRAKDEASGKLKDLGVSADAMGKGFLAVGGAITGAMALAVKGAADAQQSAARVNATLETMGDKGFKAKDAITAAANAAVKMGFDDEAASESITNLFQKTGDLNKAMEYNQLAMDLAAKKGISLEDASAKIGMAVMGNTKVFKELGVEVTKGADVTDLLAQAQQKLSGQAVAQSQTFQGQMNIMKEEFSNVSDQIGTVLLPVLTNLLKKIEPILTKTADWITNNQGLVEKIVIVVAIIGALLVPLGSLLLLLPAITAAVSALGVVLGIILSPIGLVIAAVALLGVGIFLLIKNWDLVKAKTIEVWDAIVGKVKAGVDYVIGKINAIKDAIKGLGGKAAAALGFGDVEGKAVGGSVSAGTPYVVGEQGAELFVPRVSGTIIPNNNIGGNTVNIGSIVVRDDTDLANIGRMLERYLGDRGLSQAFGGG